MRFSVACAIFHKRPPHISPKPPRHESFVVTSNEPDPSLNVRDLVGLGAVLVGSVVVGLGVGWWLDARLGHAPIFTLLGLAVGVVAGVWVSWLRVREFLRS